MEHSQEILTKCPICESTSLQKEFEITDTFLSQEVFTINKCNNCGFLFTNPRPTKENIGKYYKSENYISHSNKKQGRFARAYQLVRKQNLKHKYRLLEKHTTGKKILDIGSGTGHFLAYLQSKNWNVTGIEPDAEAAEFSRKEFSLNVFPEAALDQFQEHSFDVITLWHVLEHVHNLNVRLEKIHKLLKPNGTLVLALPNPEAFDSKYYVNYWAAWDVPRHLYHFKKNDINKLSIKHNFFVKSIHPMHFDAYYVSLLSEKYKKNPLGVLRAFWVAFLSNRKSSAQKPNTSSLIYILQPNKA